ncbi:hypothetical protein JCM10450v2_001024 [Rhodotorula kratochvilovae]
MDARQAQEPSPPPSAPPVASTCSTQPTPSNAGATNAALNKKNHRELWPYGNYRSYYTFRPGSTGAPAATPDSLDGRLALLDPSLFRGKTLLDIGTNSGRIALDALRSLGAQAVVGVDIDPLLIEDAWKAAAEQGIPKEDARVEFLDGNVMLGGWFERFQAERGGDKGRIDVVTLFSITKWLHLHHGDEGMLRLFRSLHAFLPVGGVVIVEPQEFDNYKRAVKRNKDLREVFKAIQLRPPFEQEMKDAGFTLEQRIEREEGGFSRPLLVWRKER